MAAGVSSSPRPAYLHHTQLSSYPSTAANRHSSVLNTPLDYPPSSSSSSSSSPNSVFDSDPEPSPSFSAGTTRSVSLATTDSNASVRDYFRPRLSPNNLSSNTSSSNSTSSTSSTSSNSNSGSNSNSNRSSTSNNSFHSTPAASPNLPQFPLEPVAESASPPASATSPLPSRNRPHPHQQSGTNSVRGDLKLHRTGGFFAFAASALDRTQSAISPTAVSRRRSSGRLSISGDYSALSRGADSAPLNHNIAHQRRASLAPTSPSTSSSLFSAPSSSFRFPTPQSSLAQESSPYAQPYTETDPSQTAPVIQQPRVDNKMHQTSSRLLRMTDDDRPFTKDFKDLFATLVVSLLPLSAHRVRLTKVEHTFLSEDAINNLGSLKFSQSNRMPDPKDPSRIVTTTTTTTFSMAKDMARSICQRFLEARLIESADGKYQQVYTMKGSVWQLTAKGIAILDQFCSKNGIQQKQVAELIGNNLSTLVSLERDNSTDKLQTDRSTMEVVFRRFVGIGGFNVKSNVTQADSESLADYKDGLTGVKMAAERKITGKTYKETFTGKSATDWLMDCSTTVDRRETVEIANFFVEYELMECIQQDRAYMSQYPGSQIFQPTKHSIYQLSPRGRDLITGNGPRGRSSENDVAPRSDMRINDKLPRDSNTQRLEKILSDPALRLLFRENLRETHCEENLSFYVDVDEFVKSCKQAIRQAQKNPSTTSMDGIKEIMAQAYGIYNAFLAPGSPCELNIDHQLRSNLATRMTKAVGQDVAMIDTLHEVTALFEDAQNAVFKLMASDSVPKFLRTPKYESVLKNYDFDSAQYSGKPLDRSQSRSNRK